MPAILFFYRIGQTCPTAGGDIPGINAKDIVCCSTSCGTCGGSGCSRRPGGASSCCGSGVKNSDKYCDETNEAPCIIGSRPEGMCHHGLILCITLHAFGQYRVRPVHLDHVFTMVFRCMVQNVRLPDVCRPRDGFFLAGTAIATSEPESFGCDVLVTVVGYGHVMYDTKLPLLCLSDVPRVHRRTVGR